VTASRSLLRPHAAPPDGAHAVADPSGDEQALVARIRAGDGDAFVALFRAYYARLRVFAERFVGGPEAAEDLVHDTFLALWERRADWVVGTTVSRYLYGAIRNRALNHIRRGRDISLDALVEPGTAIPSPELTDPHADPYEAACAAEFRDAVSRTLTRLPRRCREVCVLRWQYQLTYPEIAHLLGVSVKAVEAHVGAGLKLLRRRLAAFR
jgi:RNA polymerase sigma-70 factor (ECF subfamily)